MSEMLFGEYPAHQSKVGLRTSASMGVDTFRLMSELGQLNYVGLAAGTVLRSFFPDELSRAELQSHPHQAEYFFAMTNLSISVNNFMDIYPTKNMNDNKSLEYGWHAMTARVNRTIGKFPDNERVYYRHMMNSYKREIVFLEQYVRTNVLDTGEIHTYRRIMNAITVWHLGAGLFRHDQIRALGLNFMLGPHAGWSFEALEKKYQWIMSEHPPAGSMRKFAALFQTVMGMQFIDDAMDKKSDEKIQAPSLRLSEEERTTQMNAYFRRAEAFGVSKPLLEAIKGGFKGFKRILTELSHGDRMGEHKMFIATANVGTNFAETVNT